MSATQYMMEVVTVGFFFILRLMRREWKFWSLNVHHSFPLNFVTEK